ncbi:DUF2612 domain-containing protein [Clostridium saccharoperbutylacetonicum]|uniref:DUF2612 domain-containing protein n=1 Tax=Clostridium saccharoperbutylacetonicum TaxID=36745 RepID=UPI0039E98699
MAIDKYLDNITSQHRDKPKFISWLSAHLNKIDSAYNVVKSLDVNFDLDYAIGSQLDMLGQIVGRKRELPFQPMYGYSPILEDEYYRLVLKTKVAMNNWDGTVQSMYTIWDNIFGNDNDLDLQLQDNQDMSFNAYITGYVDLIQQQLIQHGYIIPKPEGVRVNYIGRSKVDFDIYHAMVVNVCKTETWTMDFDQSEKMQLNNYSSIVISQIKTETLALSSQPAVINYMLDENGNYILDQNSNKIVI